MWLHELTAPHNNPVDTNENIITIIQRKWCLELLQEKMRCLMELRTHPEDASCIQNDFTLQYNSLVFRQTQKSVYLF